MVSKALSGKDSHRQDAHPLSTWWCHVRTNIFMSSEMGEGDGSQIRVHGLLVSLKNWRCEKNVFFIIEHSTRAWNWEPVVWLCWSESFPWAACWEWNWVGAAALVNLPPSRPRAADLKPAWARETEPGPGQEEERGLRCTAGAFFVARCIDS